MEFTYDARRNCEWQNLNGKSYCPLDITQMRYASIDAITEKNQL